MKKIMFVFVACACMLQVNAQRFGVKAGYNLAKVAMEISGLNVSTDNLSGFQLGVVGEFGLTESVYFNPGLLYSVKGGKVKNDGEMKSILNYLEIPLNIGFKQGLTDKLDFFAQAGPYAGIGISGKYKYQGESVDVKFGSSDEETKRLDFGFNVGTGVEISNVQVGLNYGLGLTNLANESGYTEKNRVFSITVGYFF